MGYLIIDNRASGGGVIEKDTTHCRHCQAVIDVKTHQIKSGGHCFTCSGPLCGPCAKKAYETGLCEPWKKKIDQQWEAMNRRSILEA
jgi:hypothetical protein